VIRLKHGKIELALHELRGGTGTARALLLLHGLGERSPERVPRELTSWPGPIFALDFTGHGASTIPRGGGYTAEILMADADAALGKLGSATVVGRGLGAYVAMLLAGGRPEQVRGAILRDGPGLAGGGSGVSSACIPYVDARAHTPPDPFALVELSRDIRPRDYAVIFARQATQRSGLDPALFVCALERADWIASVCDEVGVEVTTLPQALAACASIP
jgi:pimeloyl-ACP methyl ester carboxylesterase